MAVTKAHEGMTILFLRLSVWTVTLSVTALPYTVM